MSEHQPTIDAGEGSRNATFLTVSLLLGWVVPTLVGVGLGLDFGHKYVWLDRIPGGGWTGTFLFNELGSLAITGLFGFGGAALLGLVLLLPDRTRTAGYLIYRLLLGAVVGAMIGLAVAPRYQFGADVVGTLHVRLSAPVAAAFEVEAICEIEDNGSNVESVRTTAAGRVGVDSLTVEVGIGSTSGSFKALINEGGGYEGSIEMISAGADRKTGTASFASRHAGRYRVGGEGGAESIAGEITWACTQTPVPSPEPDPSQVLQGPLQGWFALSGVVDMPHPCSHEGPCLPFGRAIATCFRAVPFRANHFETVVPWIGDSRARLILDIDLPVATLTIETDDGSATQLVQGRAQVSETGRGLVDRKVTAGFQLAEGPLRVEVEYSCSDNVEPRTGQGTGDGTVPGPIGTATPVGVNQWLASASGATPDGSVALAFDDNIKTLWNSGAGPEQWIQVDLGGPRTLRIVRLIAAQHPPSGNTVHQVLVGATEDDLRIVHVFDGTTTDGLVLVQVFDPALHGVRYVRILTLESSSWVAWFEMKLAVD